MLLIKMHENSIVKIKVYNIIMAYQKQGIQIFKIYYIQLITAMYKKPQQTKAKNNNLQSSSAAKFVNKSIQGSLQNIFISKFSIKKKESSSYDQQVDTKSVNFDSSQPLTFSNLSRKRFSETGEIDLRYKLSKYMHSQRVNLTQISGGYQELKEQFDKLKKQHQELKNHYGVLLNHVEESKKTCRNLNQAYQRKCEETQTLKSIVNSIKRYIFDQDSFRNEAHAPYYNFNIKNNVRVNFSEDSIVQYPISQQKQNQPQEQDESCKENKGDHRYQRKTSINDDRLVINSQLCEGQLSERMLCTIQKYTKMKLVQSVKGSNYDLCSQELI